MTKTRSRSKIPSTKKEEESKTEVENKLLLNGIINPTRQDGKITKRNVPTRNNSNSPASEIKSEEEEESDDKFLLQYQVSNKCRKITQEQIERLIGYIVNDKLTVTAASRKVKLSGKSASKYYNIYLEDPERKIPQPLSTTVETYKRCTHEQIKTFIEYVATGEMSIEAAARKVNIGETSGRKYYNMYIKDPEHRIPSPKNPSHSSNKPCTQDQIRSLISFIVTDHMSIPEASAKAKMGISSAHKYYNIYINDPEHKIPRPLSATASTNKRCTQQQIEEFIEYIEDDKMSIRAASRKVNISETTGYKYYNAYAADPERKIPKLHHRTSNTHRLCTQEQINALIESIVNDNMSVKAAAKKVNISQLTGYKYYNIYLDDPERNIPKPLTRSISTSNSCTQDQINEFIECVVSDKMSVSAASRKMKMNGYSARKYYSKYLKDPNHEIPAPRKRFRRYYQDQVKELITYIVNDKMTIKDAATKAKIGRTTARKYYRMYLNDLHSQIPTN